MGETSQAIDAGAGQHARVLVVDDDEDIRTLVRVDLEAAGYAVDTAVDGGEALEQLRDDPPDLLLLDVMMPRVDGWTVLQNLQDDRTLREVPVVLLTALGGDQHVARGQLTGAVQHVTKPFTMQRLRAEVERALQPLDDAGREARRAALRSTLRQLAEQESGRTGSDHVQVSNLGRRPDRRDRPGAALPAAPAGVAPTAMTALQRAVADRLAAGEPVTAIAAHDGVSRTAVYATRRRIARHLGVPAAAVPDAWRRCQTAAVTPPADPVS